MQTIPRIALPEAILEGQRARLSARLALDRGPVRSDPLPDARAIRTVRLFYRYGGSNLGTMPDSKRYVQMYQSPNLEFVVNQSIWFEGEAKFADVILPACTSFERWDISEWSGISGFAHHAQMQLNHRVVVMQHKCIEPLGESKSDYHIFRELAHRHGPRAPTSRRA